MASLTPQQLPWVSIYLLFTVICLLMTVIIFMTRFPKVELKEEEIAGAWDTHVELFKQKKVILFFFGIFCYVGTEQGIANWISEFLRTYHGLTPEIEGARAVGLFWGMMTVGCILGLFLLKVKGLRHEGGAADRDLRRRGAPGGRLRRVRHDHVRLQSRRGDRLAVQRPRDPGAGAAARRGVRARGRAGQRRHRERAQGDHRLRDLDHGARRPRRRRAREGRATRSWRRRTRSSSSRR